jgi:hypothetical protein
MAPVFTLGETGAALADAIGEGSTDGAGATGLSVAVAMEADPAPGAAMTGATSLVEALAGMAVAAP